MNGSDANAREARPRHVSHQEECGLFRNQMLPIDVEEVTNRRVKRLRQRKAYAMADQLTNRISPRRSRLWVLLLLIALVAAACGSDDSVTDAAADAVDAAFDEAEEAADSGSRAFETDDSEAAFDGDDEEAFDDADPASADGEADNPLGSGGAADGLDAQSLGREIIFTARLAVDVDNVAEAGAEATRIITEVGGFVFGQETSGGNEPRSEITFKVRPEDFSEALDALGGIGELRNQSITTDDVTERVVDLNSRIEVADLGVERLRNALEEAPNLEDFAEIERLLLARESELEVMRGQLRTLRDQIDLATITLVLAQDRIDNLLSLEVSLYEGHDNGSRCPAGSFGDQRLEPGNEITLCFLARNDGEQTLRDVTVTETALAIDGNEQLITVFGEDELRPGQTFIQAIEIDVERDLFLRVGATGVPTDGVSDEQAAPTVSTETNPRLRVNEDAADPGFGDGFGAGVELLSRGWTVAVVLVGFLIPLLVVVPFIALAWFGVRRLRTAGRAKKHERIAASMPPPPSAPTGDHEQRGPEEE